MSSLSLDSRPRLARGCRLRDSGPGQTFLLVPEGALRLNGSGLQITRLCTGDHSLHDIIDRLTSEFRAERDQVEAETIQFLTRLYERRVVDFE